MSTIVKAAGAAHFLSLVPAMLGFTPHRSLVLVPFSRGRSAGAMRLDLPASDDPVTLDRFASTCLGMVCRVHDADGLAAVFYTDASCESGLPHAELARLLAAHAKACGLHVTDLLARGSDGWGSHLDPDCPPGGRSLAELDIPAAADLPEYSGDQTTGATLPRHTSAERERVDQALHALGAALHVLCGLRDEPSAAGSRIDPEALAAACELDDLTRLFERALTQDAAHLPTYTVACLAWCLSRPALRDIALVQWCGDEDDGEAALEAQRRWEDGAEYPADLAMTMWGEGRRPEPDRLATALELVRHVAALAPRELRPGPLATCAWLSWALGRSTHAERYAMRAVRIDPQHGLSEIVLSFIAAGHLPDWAFRPR